jgi:hypothetical protein
MNKRVRGAGHWLWALSLAGMGLAGCGSGTDAAVGNDAGGAGGQLDDTGLHVMPGAGAMAGSKANPDSDKPSAEVGEISVRSFAVKAHLQLAGEGDGDFWESCQDFDFTGRFVEQEGEWSFVAASSGGFASAVVHPRGAGRYEIDAADEWPDAALIVPVGACDSQLYLTQLSFKAGVPDALGRFAEFTAAGAGLLESQSGDVLYSAEVELRLVGAPDTKPPSLRPPSAELHPLEANEIWASEALDEATVATLSASGGEEVELAHTRSAADGPFWSFDVPPAMAFGQALALRARGTDLAGNALLSKGMLRTAPDPGLQAQDGFEGELLALATQPLKLVSQGALGGSRSLLIDDGDKVTFHLATGGGALLRFDARNLVFDEGGSDSETEPVRVTLGVVGGTQVISKDLPMQHPPTGLHPGQPPQVAMEVPLPETGDELIVTFQIAPFYEADCGLISCDPVPALIDNLRVE